MKICKVCGENKEYIEFSKNKTYKDGHSSKCKKCVSEYRKEYSIKNKDKIRDRNKKYREKNAEVIKVKKKIYYEENKDGKIKEYYDENKETIKEKRKIYLSDNKEKIKESKRKYREENKESISLYNKSYFEENKEYFTKYYEINKERILIERKEWRIDNNDLAKINDKEKREKNKESISKSSAKYYRKTKIKWREYHRKRVNEKRKNDPLFKLKMNIRCSIKRSIKENGYSKSNTTENILGCNFDHFKQYLESKFQDWMSWDNYGLYNGELNYGWDLDHIIPISTASSEADIYKLNHYTNFQPLCSFTNRYIKVDKLSY
jgi:hypothetical protein